MRWAVSVGLLVACAPPAWSPPAFRGDPVEAVRVLAGPGFAGRRPGSCGSERAQEYLVAAFRRIGLKPAVGSDFRSEFFEGTNIVGFLPGAGHEPWASQVIVVGAHYDHLGKRQGKLYPGANDNASGVAAMLAAARAIAAAPPASRRGLLVVAFDAEETGLLGARALVARPPFPLSRVAAAVVLDIVGARAHDTFGNRLFVFGSEKSPELQGAVAATGAPAGLTVTRAGLHLVENTPAGRMVWSDYAPFRERRVPFVWLTTGVGDTYHQTSDTAATIVPEVLSGAARWIEAHLRLLLTAPNSFSFEPKREEIAHDARQVLDLVRLSLAPGSSFLASPLVERAKLEAHRAALEAVTSRLSRGLAPAADDLAAMRFAVSRLVCYSGGPKGQFAAFCNSF